MNNIKVLYSYLFAFSPYIRVSSKCCIHILLPFLHVFKFCFVFSLGDSLGQWMCPGFILKRCDQIITLSKHAVLLWYVSYQHEAFLICYQHEAFLIWFSKYIVYIVLLLYRNNQCWSYLLKERMIASVFMTAVRGNLIHKVVVLLLNLILPPLYLCSLCASYASTI